MARFNSVPFFVLCLLAQSAAAAPPPSPPPATGKPKQSPLVPPPPAKDSRPPRLPVAEVLRNAPPLIPLENLKVASGEGEIRRKQAAERPAGAARRTWVVVTGAVASAKQQDAFFDALKSTPANIREEDFVHFVGFRVKRAELPASDAAAVLDWDAIPELPLDKLQAEFDSWDGEADEPVAAENREDALCMLLPRWVAGKWRDADVGHPQVPMAKKPNPQAPPGKPGTLPTKEEAQQSAPADYRLFRFLDLTAQPGKTYCYRVQLIVRNPNFQLPDRILADPKDGKIEFKSSPWSEPSPIIATPAVPR